MTHRSDSNSRLYDRNFVLAMASQTCFVISNTLMAHYARWIEFLGGSVSQVGWIMGTGAIVGLFLRPWLGQWINRLGARTMWLTGYGVFAVGSIGNLLIDDLGLAIYSLRAFLVLGAAIVFASSLTYVTQTAPPDRRTEGIGILGVGGFLGMLMGPALGDLILSTDNRLRGDFHIMFVVASVGVLLPSVLLSFLRAPAGQGRGAPVRLKDFIRTTWEYWPGTILLINLAFGMCMTVPFIFLASYVDQVPLKIPGVSAVALFFWCYAGWGLIVRVALRRVPQQRGRRKVLLAGMFFMSVGMFFYWSVTAANPWMLVVPALITGTAHGLIFHTMMSLTIEPFPSEVRGTGSALALMMLDLGMLAGAPILGLIAEEFGFRWMFVCLGAFCFVASAAYAYSSIPVWQQRLARRRARAAIDPIVPDRMAVDESAA